MPTILLQSGSFFLRPSLTSAVSNCWTRAIKKHNSCEQPSSSREPSQVHSQAGDVHTALSPGPHGNSPAS